MPSKSQQHRRQFTALGILGALSSVMTGALGIAFSSSARSQTRPSVVLAPFEAGLDYRVLSSPVPTGPRGQVGGNNPKSSKVLVTEFFWVSCPHCHNLEPALQEWKQQAKTQQQVQFQRVHAPFGAPAEHQLYYTLEAMKLVDQKLPAMFAHIHVQRQKFDTPAACRLWAEANGLNLLEFDRHWSSAEVKQAMQQAVLSLRAYQVDGVPQLAVAGKYVTSPAMANGNQRSLKVVDYLVSLSRAS